MPRLAFKFLTFSFPLFLFVSYLGSWVEEPIISSRGLSLSRIWSLKEKMLKSEARHVSGRQGPGRQSESGKYHWRPDPQASCPWPFLTPVLWLPPASPAPPAFPGIGKMIPATASSYPRCKNPTSPGTLEISWSVGMFVSVLEHQWEWENRPHPQTKSGGVWACGIRDGRTGSKTDLGPLGDWRLPTCGSSSREEGKGAKGGRWLWNTGNREWHCGHSQTCSSVPEPQKHQGERDPLIPVAPTAQECRCNFSLRPRSFLRRFFAL